MKNAADREKLKEGNKRHKPAQKNPIRQQFELLQQTVGNQKIMQMMQAGIIPKSLPEATPQEMNSSKVNRKALEQEKILADREALLPKILEEISKKKEALETLKKAKPGTPIYANVTIQLKYASIPGEKESLDVYNTTELSSVNLSYQNMNQKGGSRQESRGYSIQELFSFVVDANEKKQEEEEEVQAKEEKAEKKDAKNKTKNKAESGEKGDAAKDEASE